MLCFQRFQKEDGTSGRLRQWGGNNQPSTWINPDGLAAIVEADMNHQYVPLYRELEGHVEFGPLQMVGCLDCTGPYGEVGDFSLATMYSHFQFGGNEPLTISMSSIDFSGTSQSELGIRGMKQGQTRPVNLFNAGVLNKTALAFGRVNMMYHGNNQFSIVGDGSARFDFSPLIDSRASLGRNAGNILGAAINYNLWLGPVWAGIPLIYGGGYNVNFTGTTFISE